MSLRDRIARFGRIRFPERTILIVLLLIAGSVWAFVEIADDVMEGESHQFDAAILRVFRNPENPGQLRGPKWMAEASQDITALGGVTLLTLITLAVLGFLWLQHRYHAMALIAVSVLGGSLLMTSLKNFFERERPSVVPHLVEVSSRSFPSGHSALSAVMYLTLGALLARTISDRRTKAYVLGVAVLLTLLVGISRVQLGVHYPTDVLAGWCLGTAWALCCAVIAHWLQQRQTS